MPTSTPSTSAPTVITPDQLLDHWQGHRRVTRRTIEAFPEDELFEFTIGGMRSFGVMAMELIEVATPIARGLATDEWDSESDRSARPKDEVLELWDEATRELDTWWPQIEPGRFQETAKAFGKWPGTGFFHVFYAIDNEIHHRAQGYVYLRALGIEPPLFFDRS